MNIFGKNPDQNPDSRTAILTATALMAFAANSIFCRFALTYNSIDPASFTTMRLASGAVALSILCMAARQKVRLNEGWGSGLLLFFYAFPFTYAYLDLGAGMGALILFGAVQMTMIVAAIYSGHRPTPGEWVGLLLAIGGLVYLLSPGLDAPSPEGSGLMILSGAAWGLYTLKGKQSASPLADNAGNFFRAAIPALLISAITAGDLKIEAAGAGFALASGILASGIGYAVWYAALKGLTAVRASIVQLSVPLLTAVAGVIFLAEEATVRLLLCSALILGGIGIAIVVRPRPKGR